MRKRLCLILFVLLVVVSAQAQNDTVVFSARGGFYNDVLPLELYNIHPDNHIRYTTNGNRPDAQSSLYEGALMLDEQLYSRSDIYTVVNCPEQDFFLPDSVQRCIVIRAAAFDENDSCVSQVVTNSYFIRALGCDTHGLPAVSLCADSLDLFDYETGIFVPGVNYDPLNPHFTGNYFMKGDDWERWSNFEFYELDNTGLNQQVGLRTHGKQSRWREQKGMKIYAREEYGEKRLRHKFFETLPINSFKHLCLKPFGAAWNGSGSKDYICSRIAQHLNMESQASRAAVLFLNGEYWGVYYVAEKPDERFLEDHLGVDIEAVNLINTWNNLECGSSDNFYSLRTWMEDADLSDDEQYAYAEAHIDIDNFIDYYVFELFSANLDWPANNVRMWQVNDGKWRWIFYDGDACLETQTFDVFANAIYDGDESYPANRRSTLFFRKLFGSPRFRERFASRFNQLVATKLSYENSKPYFDYIKQTLQGEVPDQIARFNMPANYATWEYYCMVVIDRFLRERPEKIIDELNQFLSVEEPMVQHLQCYPNPTSGEIHLSFEAEGFGATEIGIYDMMGRKVFVMPICSEQGTTEITINTNLESGVYMLKINNKAIKIVKQ